jgi:hypothetical protein
MATSDRLMLLNRHRRRNVDAGFRAPQDFTQWQMSIAPLLKFNRVYHNRFMDSATRAVAASGIQSRRPFYRQMDTIIAQAIAELEAGDAPKREMQVTGEPSVWRFFLQCKPSVQLKCVGLLGGLLLCAFLIGLGLGSNHVFTRVFSSVAPPGATAPMPVGTK